MNVETQLVRYEGLIFVHAQRLRDRVDDDQEDVRQFYRVKAWKALRSFDQGKWPGQAGVDGYVFMCLKNAEKDLLKRRRRPETSLDALHEAHPGDFSFTLTGQFEDAEQVYGEVHDDDLIVPNTLSELERTVVVMLYRDYKQTEIAVALTMDKRAIERVVRSIRTKLEDWRPTMEAPADVVELAPRARARAAMAA